MSQSPTRGFRYPSYWIQTADRQDFPVAHGTTSVDVAVVGGGITGLTTAFLLKRAGFRVGVLEAGQLAGGATGGSYGRLSALEAPPFATLEKERGTEGARIYAEALRWGLAQISDTVEELGISCGFTRRPALAYTTETDATGAIDVEVAAAQRAGLAVEPVADSDLPFPIEAGAYLPDQAHFHPLKYCLALARFIDGDGSAIFEDSRATRVSEEGDRLVVRTAGDARISAQWVVMACGLPPLDRGGFFARTVPLRSHCVALEGRGSLPDSLSIRCDEPARWVHSVPRSGKSPLLLVGGEDHPIGNGEDARDRYSRLEAYAREHFPVGNVEGCWSSQDYATADSIPMIGRVPFGSSHLLVATGLRRGGLTMGPAAARVLSNLVMEKPTPWGSLFEASRARFAPSSWDRVRAQAATAGDGRSAWPAGGGDAPESVAPGAAAICTRNGEPLAVFREPGGTLHVLSAACTHRGCQVAWNAAERTWDCPCHGSRFGIDGGVLHGPAVTPLQRIEED